MSHKFPINRIIIGFTLLIIFLSIVGCSSQSEESFNSQNNSNKQSSDKETIKIGLITPLTGGSSSHGNDTIEAAELIEKQINDAGGILDGRKIELVIEDDKSLPEQGVTAFKKLTSQGVNFIAGTMNSSVAIAMTNVAKDSDVIYFITGAQAPQPLELQTKGNIFGMTYTNVMYGDNFHNWIIENLNLETVFVIAENTDFGNNEIEALKENWKDDSAPEIIAIEHFERSETDFSVLLTMVRELNPDALYVAAAGPSFNASIFRQAQQLGVQSKMLMIPGNMAEDFVEEGGAAVEGVISADIYHHSLDNEINNLFVDEFQDMHNDLPAPMNVTTWEAIKLLINAIEEVGNIEDIESISKLIKESTLESPRGTITFNEIGRAQAESIILEVKDGKIIPVE